MSINQGIAQVKRGLARRRSDADCHSKRGITVRISGAASHADCIIGNLSRGLRCMRLLCIAPTSRRRDTRQWLQEKEIALMTIKELATEAMPQRRDCK